MGLTQKLDLPLFYLDLVRFQDLKMYIAHYNDTVLKHLVKLKSEYKVFGSIFIILSHNLFLIQSYLP